MPKEKYASRNEPDIMKTFKIGCDSCKPKKIDRRKYRILNSGKEETNISLYPNPAKDELNLTFGNRLVENIIIITNTLGEEVYRQNNYSNKAQIDVSQFNKGIYFIGIENIEGEQLFQEKFVVQH